MIARRLLLAASTNPWLRDRATRTAFVRTGESDMQPAYGRANDHQMSSIVTRKPTA